MSIRQVTIDEIKKLSISEKILVDDDAYAEVKNVQARTQNTVHLFRDRLAAPLQCGPGKCSIKWCSCKEYKGSGWNCDNCGHRWADHGSF